MVQTHQTRESYLESFVNIWKSHSEKLGYPLPPVRVSCGFPSKGGLGGKRQKLGETWEFEASLDGVHEIFVSPLISNTVEVLAVLLHQLGYAAVGKKDKAKFKDYAKSVGLIGKPPIAAGPELEHFLKIKIEEMGEEYPHSRLDPDRVPKDEKKGSGCRFVKVACPECSYTIRTTAKWIKVGLPTCPCSTKMVGPDLDPDGEIITPEAA